jgi:hypothetical protein
MEIGMRRSAASFVHLAVVMCIVVLTMSVGLPWALAAGEIPDPTWMTNGRVYALAQAGDTLYIGGAFTSLLPPNGSSASSIAVSNLAAISVSTGEPIAGWAPAAGGSGANVQALAVRAGKVYVGGSFTTIDGTAVQNLAEVDGTTGAVDTSFTPLVEKAVYALLASDSRLYAGGAFGKVDGLSRGKLAAWDLPSGTLSQQWRPRAAGGPVRDLTFDATNQTIFIGGAFTSMTQAGTSYARQSVARVYADSGLLHPWAIPQGTIETPQTAWDLEATADRLHGGFGRGPNYAASFRNDATNVGTRIWKFSTVGNVQTIDLSPDGTRLYVGGHFGLGRLQQQVCSTRDLHGLISVNPVTGALFCDWVPQLAPFGNNYQGPKDMIATGSYLWVGGGWSTIGGVTQRNLARFTR